MANNAAITPRTANPAIVRQGLPDIRRIALPDLRAALARGWEDFAASRVHFIVLGLIYPVLGLLLGRLASGEDTLQLIYPLIAGFALVGPFAAVGLEEMSRRRELGLSVGWADAFAVLRAPRLPAILILGLLLCVVFVIWLGAAQGVFHLTVGRDGPLAPDAFVAAVLGTPVGWTMLLLGTGVGFCFAVAVLVIGVISFPLLLDTVDLGAGVGEQVSNAMRVSIRAVLANPAPMAAWGATVAALLAIGSLPLLVGLAVVMPWLGHATWHLYRRTVG